MTRSLRSGTSTPARAPSPLNCSTPVLLRQAEAAIAGLATTDDVFESPVGSISLAANNTPGATGATPTSLMPPTRQQAPSQGTPQLPTPAHANPAINPTVAALLQEHGLQSAASPAVGASFDPQWVCHRNDNPVQRGPSAPEFCAPFSLAQDPRHAAIAAGPSFANKLEAEVHAWALSYLFDILGFIGEARTQGSEETLSTALATIHTHLSAVFEQLDRRVSELWTRAAYPANQPLLEKPSTGSAGVWEQGCN